MRNAIVIPVSPEKSPIPAWPGYRLNPEEVRRVYFNTIAEDDMLRQGSAADVSWNRGHVRSLHMAAVYCEECAQTELVPSLTYSDDFYAWYHHKLHPRFSAHNALRGPGRQLLWETTSLIRQIATDNDVLKDVLASVKTEEEFLAHPLIVERLRVNVYVRGRRIRVTADFARRYKARNFTVEDFFRQDNQELRRIILRFVPMQEIIGRMNQIATDPEGSIYEANGGRRYLHVTCPSTGQEYLLEIPRQVPDGEMQRAGGGTTWTQTRWKELILPADARRWTFNLPADAEFVKEA